MIPTIRPARRTRIWPYRLSGCVVSSVVSAWLFYRHVVNDAQDVALSLSSPTNPLNRGFGLEVVLIFSAVAFVGFSAIIGSGLGALAGYFVRFLSRRWRRKPDPPGGCP